MKIPKVNIGNTQTLGRNDIGAVGAKARQAGATGKQQQRMMSLMAGVAGDYIQRQQNVEYDNAIAQTQIQINAFQKNHMAKKFYTSDEIPTNISGDLVPRTTTNYIDGEAVVSERDSIPAYEVYPHLLKQQLEGMTEVESQKVSSPVLQKEYLRVAQIKNSEMMMSAGLAAEQAQKAFVFEETVIKAGTAFKTGNAVEGEFYVKNLVADSNVKAKLLQDGYTDVEIYDVNAAIKSNDPETVMTMLHRVDDAQYEGYLTESMRQSAVVDLNAKLDALGAGRMAEIERQLDIKSVKFTESIIAGDVDRVEIEERFAAWEKNPDDPEGIDADLYKVSMGLRRGFESAQLTEERRLERVRVAEEKAATIKRNKMETFVNGVFFANLDKGIDEGTVNLIDLDKPFEDYIKSVVAGEYNPETLEPKQYTTLRHHIITRNNKATAATKRFNIGDGVVNGTIDANRENSEQQSGVDEYVKQMGWGKDIARMVKITQDTSIMPQSLTDMIVDGALNQTGEAAMGSLTAYGAILDAKKSGTLDIRGTTREMLDDAWYLHRGGMSADEAFKKADEIQQMPPKQRELNRDTYTTEKYQEGNVSNLTNRMSNDEDRLYKFDPGWNVSALGPSTRMIADYENVVQTEFERTGNIDMARQTAWNGLTEVWGPSGVGAIVKGLQVETIARPEKWGVERTLGISTPIAKGRLGAFAESLGVDPENVVIKGDAFTSRESNDKTTKQRTSWAVYIIDPETLSQVQLYDKENKPLRWVPNNWIDQGTKYIFDEKNKVVEANKAEFKRMKLGDLSDEEAYKLANP